MKRLTVIATAVALIVLAAPAVQSATTKPSYAAPGRPISPFGSDTTLEVVWTASPYADFYKVKYSTRSDMSNPRYLNSRDPNANAVTLEDLRPATRYYLQVAVMNWDGVRLSSYSTRRSATTESAGWVDE